MVKEQHMRSLIKVAQDLKKREPEITKNIAQLVLRMAQQQPVVYNVNQIDLTPYISQMSDDIKILLLAEVLRLAGCTPANISPTGTPGANTLAATTHNIRTALTAGCSYDANSVLNQDTYCKLQSCANGAGTVVLFGITISCKLLNQLMPSDLLQCLRTAKTATPCLTMIQLLKQRLQDLSHGCYNIPIGGNISIGVGIGTGRCIILSINGHF